MQIIQMQINQTEMRREIGINTRKIDIGIGGKIVYKHGLQGSIQI